MQISVGQSRLGPERNISRKDRRTPIVHAGGMIAALALLEAHVWFAGKFVPAVDVAPWLWDPLHVRSLRGDEDRSLRRLPAER